MADRAGERFFGNNTRRCQAGQCQLHWYQWISGRTSAGDLVDSSADVVDSTADRVDADGADARGCCLWGASGDDRQCRHRGSTPVD